MDLRKLPTRAGAARLQFLPGQQTPGLAGGIIFLPAGDIDDPRFHLLSGRRQFLFFRPVAISGSDVRPAQCWFGGTDLDGIIFLMRLRHEAFAPFMELPMDPDAEQRFLRSLIPPMLQRVMEVAKTVPLRRQGNIFALPTGISNASVFAVLQGMGTLRYVVQRGFQHPVLGTSHQLQGELVLIRDSRDHGDMWAELNQHLPKMGSKNIDSCDHREMWAGKGSLVRPPYPPLELDTFHLFGINAMLIAES
ncbi:MAG: hypothetical protein HY520_00175 [Candidatus Aenigmarchaeota archaeon]|nr:hypothetical protein [Candidatus Aenigmarchaeota archaeon]